jgi:hypothetical protein
LDNDNHWPEQGPFDFQIQCDLENVLQCYGRWLKVPYIQAFTYLCSKPSVSHVTNLILIPQGVEGSPGVLFQVWPAWPLVKSLPYSWGTARALPSVPLKRTLEIKLSTGGAIHPQHLGTHYPSGSFRFSFYPHITAPCSLYLKSLQCYRALNPTSAGLLPK